MQVETVITRVESACEWFQRLKLKYDELVLEFAFKFNLRRYTQAQNTWELPAPLADAMKSQYNGGDSLFFIPCIKLGRPANPASVGPPW